MSVRPIVAFDFDGVIHTDKSGKDPHVRNEEVKDEPVAGALEAIHDYIAAGFEVVIISSRALTPGGFKAIFDWLVEHRFPRLRITHEKVGAVIYIDDRGYHFTGNNFPSVDFIKQYKPWNR